MKLTQKQKDNIEVIGSTVLAIGTGALVELVVGGGAALVVNKLCAGGMTKAQMRLFEGIIFTGSVGTAWLVAYETLPKFSDMAKQVLEIFPTKEEEKDG